MEFSGSVLKNKQEPYLDVTSHMCQTKLYKLQSQINITQFDLVESERIHFVMQLKSV